MLRRHVLTTAAALATAAATSAAAAPRPQARRAAAPTLQRPDGAQLYLKDFGEGPTVVFVHSWALASDMWQHQMAALNAADYRTIAYDRRGHGRSSATDAGYDADSLADDLAAVMDALDLRQAALVGHSMGCGEIARYLSRHGSGRVAKVALLSPAMPYLTRGPDNPYGAEPAVFETVRGQWARDFPAWIEANKAPFFTPQTSPMTMDWVGDMMMRCSLRAAIEMSRNFVATDFRPDLMRLDRPTLVIHGDRDASAPIQITGDRVAALAPGATYKVYEGAPHGLFVTHVDRLNGDLLAFLGG